MLGVRFMIIRHGKAVRRGTVGVEDDERPLTREGERRFAEVAAGLARICDPPDVLLSSPLPRALRTAELAAEAWGGVGIQQLPALATGDMAAIAGAVASHRNGSTVAVVGHRTCLLELIVHAIGAVTSEAFDFKKGGVALLDLPAGLSESGGRLLWFVTPKVLRMLARTKC